MSLEPLKTRFSPSRLEQPFIIFENPDPKYVYLPSSSVKRPAGMGSILNRIGTKKQKMSTLEKSKMDWDAFKTEEGIADELAIHNRGKEGYV